MLCSIELNDGIHGLKWCQCRVTNFIGDNRVEVEWDPAPDIEGCQERMVGEQVMLPSKWNKDNNDSAWRMDVDSDDEHEIGDESDAEDEVEFLESDLESEDDGDSNN